MKKYRSLTVAPDDFVICYVETPDEYFDDPVMAVGPSLIFDIGDTREAFVVRGDRERITELARMIEVVVEPSKPGDTVYDTVTVALDEIIGTDRKGFLHLLDQLVNAGAEDTAGPLSDLTYEVLGIGSEPGTIELAVTAERHPDPWRVDLDRIEGILLRMSEDDRNDAIEALRSRFNETLYTREAL
jgi:hypothetical protein